VRWFSLADALRTLSYKNEREMLEKAIGLIQGGGQPA